MGFYSYVLGFILLLTTGIFFIICTCMCNVYANLFWDTSFFIPRCYIFYISDLVYDGLLLTLVGRSKLK